MLSGAEPSRRGAKASMFLLLTTVLGVIIAVSGAPTLPPTRNILVKVTTTADTAGDDMEEYGEDYADNDGLEPDEKDDVLELKVAPVIEKDHSSRSAAVQREIARVSGQHVIGSGAGMMMRTLVGQPHVSVFGTAGGVRAIIIDQGPDETNSSAAEVPGLSREAWIDRQR